MKQEMENENQEKESKTCHLLSQLCSNVLQSLVLANT